MTSATLLLLGTVLATTAAYNLEPRHADIIDNPAENSDSYFGYSLAFWKQTVQGRVVTWLLVGAPRSNSSELRGDRVRQPGAVFKCKVKPEHSRCSPISVLSPDEKRYQSLYWRGARNLTARAWVGATIAVEEKTDGAVAVCAPRMKLWTHQFVRMIPGMCFSCNLESNTSSSLANLSTVYPYTRNWVSENGFYAGLAQAGMSAHFVQNTTVTHLVVGAPGIEYFKGAVSVYQRKKLYMPLNDHVNYHGYLGYSVTSARFHSDGRILFVSGAPRAKGLDSFSGVVYIMENPLSYPWTVISVLQGQQMGEYFGACVVAMDIDSDGNDDLLVVGAPLYSHRSDAEEYTGGDQGRIYVFINTGEAVMELSPGTVMGSACVGARFGSSVAAIGDLNKDGFSDLAVGAPYEEESGAVYIYHGQSGGLNIRYSQRILGSEVRSGLSGFGISIVSGVDVDDNSFLDLAIGSHESGQVAIVKSYPIIEFEATLEPNVKKLSNSDTNFTVTASLRFSSRADAHLLQEIVVGVSLKVDPTFRRAVLGVAGVSESSSQYLQVRLRRGIVFHFTRELKVKDNLFLVMQPIELTMEYKIVDDPSINRAKRFCRLCPMTEPHQPSKVHVTIPLATGCRSSVCWANLTVTASSSTQGKPIVFGRDMKITLNVSIHNTGETAYLTRLVVMLPKKNMLLKMDRDCSMDEAQGNQLVCRFGTLASANNTKAKSNETIPFELDLRSVSMETTQLTFNMSVWSSSEEQTPEDNTFILSLPVQLVTGLTFTGNTMSPKVKLSSTTGNNSSSEIIPLVHNYGVVNNGPSPAREVNLRFKIPIAAAPRLQTHPHRFIKCFNVTVITENDAYPCHLEGPGDSDDVNALICKGLDKNVTAVAPPQEAVDGQVSDVRRRRRSVENQSVAEESEKKTVLEVNCDEDSGAECRSVTCKVGHLDAKSGATVSMQLYFDKAVLESLLKDTDILRYNTTGRAEIVDVDKYIVEPSPSYKTVNVETQFMTLPAPEEQPPWVLPLSIALGLFLVLIMVKLLSNVGFFKRGTYEKLQSMREKAAEEDFATGESLYDTAEPFQFDEDFEES